MCKCHCLPLRACLSYLSCCTQWGGTHKDRLQWPRSLGLATTPGALLPPTPPPTPHGAVLGVSGAFRGSTQEEDSSQEQEALLGLSSEAEVHSGHDVTLGALTGSLSNHFRNRRQAAGNGLRGHNQRSRLPQTSLHGHDKTKPDELKPLRESRFIPE